MFSISKITLYITKKITIALLLVLIIITTLLILLQSFQLLDLIMNRGFSFVILFKFIMATLPRIWVEVLPFILLVTTIFTWNSLIANQEITIIQASGKNLLQVATAPIIMGLIITIISSIFIFYVNPKSVLYYFELRHAISSSYNLKLIEPNKFVNINSNISFYVKKMNANKLENIIIFKKNSATDYSTLHAENGYINIRDSEVVLLLDKVDIIEKGTNQGTSFISLDKYIFSLDTTTEKYRPPLISAKTSTLFQTLNYKNLPIMQELKNNPQKYHQLARKFHQTLVKGIINSLLPIFFALSIAFFFTLTQYNRTHSIKHIINSIVVCTFLKITSVILLSISLFYAIWFIVFSLLLMAFLLYKIIKPPSFKTLSKSIFF